MGRWQWQLILLASLLASVSSVHALSLDKDGDIRFGLRTYSAVRVGTENTETSDTARILAETFPHSSAGHIRQLRYFLEASLDHDLDPLLRERLGVQGLLDRLRISRLSYNLVFRFEYEGIYDFGPSEYRTHEAFNSFIEPILNRPVDPQVVGKKRRRLRKDAVWRARLFQAYLQFEVGDLFLRFGRQILAWGETDAFRLLDNINPLDPSFGGFLIPLDERRVPLDMLRLNYNIGHVGPLAGMFVEGFVALDDEVSFDPGIPIGSPWNFPNAVPTGLITVATRTPNANFEDARFGLQLKFNLLAPVVGDVTVSLAHYYTYLDLPGVKNEIVRGRIAGFPGVFPDDDPDGAGFPDGPEGSLVKAVASAPRTQITGLAATFAVPARYARKIRLGGEPIIRSEFAYFHDEARYKQSQLDPIEIAASPECLAAEVGAICTGGRRLGDSLNFVIGIDTNQYIRFLNPNQSFFISTQFFYKHLLGAAKRQSIPGVTELTGIVDGEVLPAPEFLYKQSFRIGFVHNPVDQYLQTLLIATQYYGGRVTPAMVLLYDWYGAFAALPQITFLHDPFRLTLSYSFIDATRWRGASGVSLLKDRDNFLFQFEYVL